MLGPTSTATVTAQEAATMQDEYVSTEHLFLGIVQVGGPVWTA